MPLVQDFLNVIERPAFDLGVDIADVDACDADAQDNEATHDPYRQDE